MTQTSLEAKPPKQRYYVERVDEPDHKFWLVMDRKTQRLIQTCPTRREARQAAREGNAEEESQR